MPDPISRKCSKCNTTCVPETDLSGEVEGYICPNETCTRSPRYTGSMKPIPDGKGGWTIKQ